MTARRHLDRSAARHSAARARRWRLLVVLADLALPVVTGVLVGLATAGQGVPAAGAVLVGAVVAVVVGVLLRLRRRRPGAGDVDVTGL